MESASQPTSKSSSCFFPDSKKVAKSLHQNQFTVLSQNLATYLQPLTNYEFPIKISDKLLSTLAQRMARKMHIANFKGCSKWVRKFKMNQFGDTKIFSDGREVTTIYDIPMATGIIIRQVIFKNNLDENNNHQTPSSTESGHLKVNHSRNLDSASVVRRAVQGSRRLRSGGGSRGKKSHNIPVKTCGKSWQRLLKSIGLPNDSSKKKLFSLPGNKSSLSCQLRSASASSSQSLSCRHEDEAPPEKRILEPVQIEDKAKKARASPELPVLWESTNLVNERQEEVPSCEEGVQWNKPTNEEIPPSKLSHFLRTKRTDNFFSFNDDEYQILYQSITDPFCTSSELVNISDYPDSSATVFDILPLSPRSSSLLSEIPLIDVCDSPYNSTIISPQSMPPDDGIQRDLFDLSPLSSRTLSEAEEDIDRQAISTVLEDTDIMDFLLKDSADIPFLPSPSSTTEEETAADIEELVDKFLINMMPGPS